jgi:hypothetical protein
MEREREDGRDGSASRGGSASPVYAACPVASADSVRGHLWAVSDRNQKL